MTHAEHMAEAGPLWFEEARDEFLMRAAEGTPPTLQHYLERLPVKHDRVEFVAWWVEWTNAQAAAERKRRREAKTAALVTLADACEDAALDLESPIDEDTDFSAIAARLRAAVAVARGGRDDG